MSGCINGYSISSFNRISKLNHGGRVVDNKTVSCNICCSIIHIRNSYYTCISTIRMTITCSTSCILITVYSTIRTNWRRTWTCDCYCNSRRYRTITIISCIIIKCIIRSCSSRCRCSICSTCMRIVCKPNKISST